MEDKLVNIKQELKAVGITQAKLAHMLKVSPAAVNYVVKRKKKTPRICLAISMILNRPKNDIWPAKETV